MPITVHWEICKGVVTLDDLLAMAGEVVEEKMWKGRKTMDKHFEVWKVIDNGEGTEGVNNGRKRYWIIVDKIVAADGGTAYKDVVDNLSKFGYAIVSSGYPVITAKLGKAPLETYVVSPAGKEYGRPDWDDTIAPKIAIRRVAGKAVLNTDRVLNKAAVRRLKKILPAAPQETVPVT